jgi:glycosyltransferase involved in cell wall biosynthesis
MRVGVYLGGLNPDYAGGLKTYVIGLINGLTRNVRGHETVIFAGDEVRQELAERIGCRAKSSFVSAPAVPGSLIDQLTMLPGLDAFHVSTRERRMRRVSQLLEAHCDVVLFPLCFMATYRLRIPSIVSFHDLQHERFPSFFSWRHMRARRVRFGATFRHATLLQASSNAMKREALEIYGDRVSDSRIAVIPEGVDFAEFAASPDPDWRRGYDIPAEFLLYPAQMWHHKNHLRLLRALEELRKSADVRIPLVLTGAEYQAAPAIRRFIAQRRLADQVFVLGRVPYPVLRGLYRQASYVLSASLYESNCLPLLEAAASGSPLIIADIPPNRESAQTFKVRMFDPCDVGSIAATLFEAWTNRHRNREAVESNREAARNFDWTIIADLYLQRAEHLLSSCEMQGAPRMKAGFKEMSGHESTWISGGEASASRGAADVDFLPGRKLP